MSNGSLSDRTPKSILLLTSVGNEAQKIAEYCARFFPQVLTFHADWGDSMPEEVYHWDGDIILSYCSRWLVPENVISRASRCAINFHPGTPEFRGTGAMNWALYENASFFGVTCHFMSGNAYTGPIVECRRFPIFDLDDAESLYERTHAHLQALAFDIIAALSRSSDLHFGPELWSGPLRTRKGLDRLARIEMDISAVELRRRIRATMFKSWRPTLQFLENEFSLSRPNFSEE